MVSRLKPDVIPDSVTPDDSFPLGSRQNSVSEVLRKDAQIFEQIYRKDLGKAGTFFRK